VADQDSGTLLMRKLTQGNVDTFQFKNHTLEKGFALKEATPIYLSDDAGHYQVFFADPESTVTLKVVVNGGLKVTFLEGSASNDIFRKLIAKQEPVQQFSQNLAQKFQEPGANKDSINNVLQHLNGLLKNNFFDFLKENSSSEVTAFVIYSSVMNERSLTLHMADTMYQFLTGKAKTSFYGTELNKTMMKLKSVEPGYTAPDFTLTDSSGKKFSLRKIKGEYILLDFWASWCGPCKAEIPYMKKAYELFHEKGFEIVSVSIDSKRDNWIAALNMFKMPWIHLLEEDHIVSDLYHFPTIPKTLLMDKTGKIIAADLRGERLEKKLSELLDQ
jgi:peroxiredoxin